MGVGDSLIVPVLQAVDHPLKLHPPPRLSVKVISCNLLDEWPLETGTAALEAEFAVRLDGLTNGDVEMPRARTAVGTGGPVLHGKMWRLREGLTAFATLYGDRVGWYSLG